MSEWTEHPHQVIGARLRAAREAFTDDSVRAFAKRLGVSPMAVSGWEVGARRIPVESAERYCDLFGLTLDWIYRGRRDGLSETASKML
jgi:transcriptional regulator with XRE-family HTH domain